MLKRLLYIFISIGSFCNGPSKNNIRNFDSLKSDTANTVVLPYEQVAEFLHLAGKPDVISRVDMKIVDSITEHVVYANWIGEHGIFPEDTFQNVRPISEILKYYKRQMVCYRNKKNDKIIWVNFFCNSGRVDDWKTEWVFVDDGGDCFFNFKINLTKVKTFDVRVNGFG